MWLLDTNVISELRKLGDGKADANVVAWLAGHDAAQFFLSAIRVCSRFSHARVAWQMVSGKARDAGKGVPLAKFRNAAWGHLPSNPSGRVSFCAGRRLSSFICSKQTSLLIPCPSQKLLPARARVRLKREQTLV